jgi:hypothetical protein
MMEKYLHDTISARRKPEVERISKADLIPAAIKHWYYVKDSLRQIRLAKLAKEMDINTQIEAPKVDSKTTFDPEAEPNRKDNNDTVSNKKSPMLNPDDKKNKRDSLKP